MERFIGKIKDKTYLDFISILNFDFQLRNVKYCPNCDSEFERGKICAFCDNILIPKIAKIPYMKLNDYLTLKLEFNHTNIYVKGNKFISCKYLILNFNREKIRLIKDFVNLDEIIDTLGHSLENEIDSNIPSIIEYWGHCSNMRVWVDYDYNTDILSFKLAFPLLKRLSDIGDMKARKIIKDEIRHRILSNHMNSFIFLFNERYLEYFTPEELDYLRMDECLENWYIYFVISHYDRLKILTELNYTKISIGEKDYDVLTLCDRIAISKSNLFKGKKIKIKGKAINLFSKNFKIKSNKKSFFLKIEDLLFSLDLLDEKKDWKLTFLVKEGLFHLERGDGVFSVLINPER